LRTYLPYHSLSLCTVFALWLSACKEQYTPPAGRESISYLVVNGFINGGNDSTVISLSRTRSLDDSVKYHPELQAQVTVLGELGETYFLQDEGNGRYASPTLNLSPYERYQLQILTSEGKKYLSDSVPVKISPPIDSISWIQDSTNSADSKKGVTIYVNTHDPSGNTRYYQWDYVETWEHHAAYESFFLLVNNRVVLRNPDQFTYRCWTTVPSSSLTLSSSAKLSEDVIFLKPLMFIPRGDIKLGVKYSIFLKQYAITKEAYEYWENLKKNTELMGSIFDPQPSQLTGNIHCVTNPNEPVLGWLTASTVQEQRIFIDNTKLTQWGFSVVGECYVVYGNFDLPSFRGLGYRPIDVYNGPSYTAAFPSCLDCTSRGGNTIKPAFWPPR
jgi:hypothetical protein